MMNKSNGLIYEMNSAGCAYILHYMGSDPTARIPAQLSGKPVIEVRLDTEAFSGTAANRLVIEEGIQAVHGRLSENITEIELPNSLHRPGTELDNGSMAGALVNGSGLLRYGFASNNRTFRSIDGVVFNKLGTALLAAPQGIGPEYTVPEKTRRIGEGAFGGCSRLEKIHLPDGLKEIESSAFEQCSRLAWVWIPASVEVLWHDSFDRSCPDLQIGVAGDSEHYASVDGLLIDKALGGLLRCQDLTVTEVRVPSGLNWVAPLAFYGCDQLRHVVLPDSVHRVERGAFLRCPQLETVEVSAWLKRRSDRLAGLKADLIGRAG